MGLNRHVHYDEEKTCFFCHGKIDKNLHAIDFQGCNAGGDKYLRIWFHVLCAWQTFGIFLKDIRHSFYAERMTLSAIPRWAEVQHLKIDNYQVRGE